VIFFLHSLLRFTVEGVSKGYLTVWGVVLLKPLVCFLSSTRDIRGMRDFLLKGILFSKGTNAGNNMLAENFLPAHLLVVFEDLIGDFCG
jgi:hypothetical protein